MLLSFFRKINLLRGVFEDRYILGKDAMSTYEGWANP
jgi:hypothetical protein